MAATTTEYMAYCMDETRTARTGTAFVRCIPLGLVEGAGENARARIASAAVTASGEYGVEAGRLHIVPSSRVRSSRQHLEQWLPLDYIARAAR